MQMYFMEWGTPISKGCPLEYYYYRLLINCSLAEMEHPIYVKYSLCNSIFGVDFQSWLTQCLWNILSPCISAVSHNLLQRTEFPGCVTWLASRDTSCIMNGGSCWPMSLFKAGFPMYVGGLFDFLLSQSSSSSRIFTSLIEQCWLVFNL